MKIYGESIGGRIFNLYMLKNGTLFFYSTIASGGEWINDQIKQIDSSRKWLELDLEKNYDFVHREDRKGFERMKMHHTRLGKALLENY